MSSVDRQQRSRTARRRVRASLARRRRRERLFRAAGLLATAAGLAFLGMFFASLIAKGASAFVQTHVLLDVETPVAALIDPVDPVGQADPIDLIDPVDPDALVNDSLRELFPLVTSRNDRRQLARLLSIDAGESVRRALVAAGAEAGTRLSIWVPAAATVDMLSKGQLDPDVEERLRPLSDVQIAWVAQLKGEGRLKKRFNSALFTNGDSREPELAGIRGALMGSFYMLLVTMALAFPIGVAAAVYLEEFAPRNRWSAPFGRLIEVNINNLAAVPSIVFGLLGLAVFIDWLALPRSAPLVGGLVLSLLTLPVIIIASRAAIQSVSPSIREAALALGASRMQMVFHHILPQALPGVLTGTIIGMSRALGETAPLLMIGMVAFIVDIPGGFTDPATALPVQIYLWADTPEPAFAERTSAAILVLLGFLLVMNLAAVVIRQRMENKV